MRVRILYSILRIRVRSSASNAPPRVRALAIVRAGNSERARTPQHLGVEQVHFDPREECRVLMRFLAKERFLEPVGFPSLPDQHQKSHYGTGHGHARSGATRSDRATCSFLYCRAQQRIRDSAPLREKSLKSLAGSLVMTFFLAADCCTAAEERARVRARAPRDRAMPMRTRGARARSAGPHKNTEHRECSLTAPMPNRSSDACAKTAEVCARYLFCTQQYQCEPRARPSVAHEWASRHLLIAGLVTEDVGLALDDALADAVELGNVPRLLVVAELREGPRDSHPAQASGLAAPTGR